MMMHIYEIHCTEVFRLVVMGMCKVNLEPWQAEALVFQLTAWQVKRLADNLGYRLSCDFKPPTTALRLFRTVLDTLTS